MRFLVLGGTAWLGGYVTSAALDAGHEVTCLARGASGSVPGGARFVRADRDQPEAYDALAGERWDVVVDVSRQPGQVRGAVEALADSAAFFLFVSSGNVYADHSTPDADESAVLLPPLEGDVMGSMDRYGEAKVSCERAVVDAFGSDRSMLARAGLIGGPGDIFGRSGYWPLRFARPSVPDGRVLVPGDLDVPTQVIDVRDLAAWLVEAGAERLSGAYNAGGETVVLREHLEVARGVAGHSGALVPASAEWLAAHDVAEWMGERSLPLWLADPDWRGFNARSSAKARAAGLTTRPLAETLADTLAWELEEGATRPRRAGLSDEDERALLEELAGSAVR